MIKIDLKSTIWDVLTAFCLGLLINYLIYLLLCRKCTWQLQQQQHKKPSPLPLTTTTESTTLHIIPIPNLKKCGETDWSMKIGLTFSEGAILLLFVFEIHALHMATADR